MLKDKIIQLLTEASFDVLDNFYHAEIEYNWENVELKTFRKLLKENVITSEFVDQSKGINADSWSVYSFTDGMQVVFIKFQGWSYADGHSTFDEFYEVSPVEKTITVFEKK